MAFRLGITQHAEAGPIFAQTGTQRVIMRAIRCNASPTQGSDANGPQMPRNSSGMPQLRVPTSKELERMRQYRQQQQFRQLQQMRQMQRGTERPPPEGTPQAAGPQHGRQPPKQQPAKQDHSRSNQASKNETRRRRATSPQLDDGMTAEQFKHLAEECGLEESWRPAVGLLCQLGLRQSELARLSESRPEVFQISAGTMRRKLAFLRETVGLSDIELTKVVVKCPRILEYQSESVKTRLAFLKGAGIAPKDVAKVVLKAPMIMALSVDDTLRPRAAFLREEVYLAEGKLGKLFARHPQVLTCTEDMMRQRVQFLMQECGLETEDLAHAVLAHPQVLHYKIDSMRTRLDYLRSIGMSAEQIAAGVARFPQIFSLSVATNMAPKWHYLVEHLGGNLTSLVAYPAYFSLSLAKRIVPRHRYLQQLRGGNLPLPVSMTVLKMTDKKFAVEVARTSLQEYESFREAIVEQFENAAAEASFQRSRTADTSHSDEGEGRESEAIVIAAAEDCNNESSEDWAMLMAPVQRLPGTGGPTTLGNRRPGGLSDLYAAKNGRALSASPLSTQRQNPLVRRAHPE